jgi:DNA-binding GntR family transcriptional regulator
MNNNKRTLTEKVYLTLKEKILTQKLRAGDSLSEADLAKELRVSRTPIRQALVRLQKDMLLEILPNRGVHITFITLKDLKDTFQLLQILEGAAARLAVEQIDQAKLAELEKEFIALQKEVNIIDYVDEQKIGLQLHDLILQSTGNGRMIKILQRFREQIKALSLNSIKRPGRAQEAVKEHLKVVAALKNRDGFAAENAMVSHLSNVFQNLVQFVAGIGNGASRLLL